MTADVELVGESEGEIEARVLGSAGDDDLTLNILDPEELATLTTALLDGGAARTRPRTRTTWT